MEDITEDILNYYFGMLHEGFSREHTCNVMSTEFGYIELTPTQADRLADEGMPEIDINYIFGDVTART